MFLNLKDFFFFRSADITKQKYKKNVFYISSIAHHTLALEKQRDTLSVFGLEAKVLRKVRRKETTDNEESW